MVVRPRSLSLQAATILLALLLARSGAAAAQDAAAWLERMVEAVATRSYHGTFLFRQGDQTETMEIVHSHDGKQEHERFVAQSGDERQVVRSGGRLHCHQPESATMIDTPVIGAPLKAAGHHQRLGRFYRLEIGESERVAGRNGRILHILPRDNYRYGYRIWLDNESAVPLKSQLLDQNGEVLEEMIFTRIEIEVPIPGAALTADLPTSHQSTALHNAAISEQREPRRWAIGQLPGFEPVIETNYTHPHLGYPVEHRVYSDGLATLSIFAEERGADGKQFDSALLQQGVAKGSVHARVRMELPFLFTVVGDVPRATVDHAIDAIVVVEGGEG